MTTLHFIFRVLAFAVLVWNGSGCVDSTKRFPLDEPRWVDHDLQSIGGDLAETYSGLNADAADKLVFRPLSRAFTFPLKRAAANVNSLDEVPNSSWFTNRLGIYPMTAEQVAEGPCAAGPLLDPSRGPWMVVSAKPDGANPGFIVESEGQRYLLKFDGLTQPQRASAADVIGSRIYWAAGFNTPCNQVVYFDREILSIADHATATNQYGEKHSLSKKDVAAVLAKAFRRKNQLLRAAASRFVPGRPLGPFSYEGTRGDDPNDLIPHEERRELRASRLLAAWINHYDSREQNSIDMLEEVEERRHVRHYLIDFGDSLGERGGFDPFDRRLGHAYYFDAGDVLTDAVTLGATRRPWNRAEISRDAEIFGYFSARDFDPPNWKGGYPNPAFEQMTYADALWMARIVARFSDAHLEAIVAEAKLESPVHARYIVETLASRRDAILRAYFTRYAPLAHFRFVQRTFGSTQQSLCFEDLSIVHQLVDPELVVYKMRFYGGIDLVEELGWLQFRPDSEHAHRSCVVFPVGDTRPADLADDDAPPNDPLRYGLLKIFVHQRPSVRPTSSIWLHFYDLGEAGGYRLVGIERQPEPEPPAVY